MAQAKVVTIICVDTISGILQLSVDDDHSVASHRSSNVYLNHFFLSFFYFTIDMWNHVVNLILVAALSRQTFSLHSDAGPWIRSTKGEVWPMPNSRMIKEDFYLLRPSNFDFRVSISFCNSFLSVTFFFYYIFLGNKIIRRAQKAIILLKLSFH